jgi:hypothetical protein
MATAILTYTENMTGDARFRAWGLVISNAIQALGFVKVIDAAQINFVTVARPGANASAGYEMYAFGDALQATFPIFMRVDYAIGNVTTIPALWFTFGAGQDGAGNFVGPASTVQKMAPTTTITDTQTPNVYISGSSAGGRLALTGRWNAASTSVTTNYFFSVERTHDPAGADTGEGLLIIGTTAGTNSTSFRQHVYMPTGAGTVETTLGVMIPSVGTGANGTQVAVYPIFLTKGIYLNPSLNILGYVHANIAALTPVSVTIYGAAHVFLPLGATFGQLGIRVGPTGVTGSTFLIRWE